ncbi:hypothetical protein [Glaciimonas sp. PCH181]|uniref:hypothetical protein n=1 Tax=Glaciimonas sp. PCH181 TaxID=2133943 RepID=UPI001CEDF142|nr:hypothetical protein [Glaciimonas sp. PCH181]
MGKLMQRHSEQSHSYFSLPAYLLGARNPDLHADLNQSVLANDGISLSASERHPQYSTQNIAISGNLAAFPATTLTFKKPNSVPSAISSHGSPSKINNVTQMTAVRRTEPRDLPRGNAEDHQCIMHLTISADSVTQLRHIVMGACGDVVAFIRIQPIAHASRMKVWLGLSKPEVGRIMAAVMQNLSGAEFGQIRPW